MDFETDDIYLASYLDLSGCTLLRTRKHGQKVYFVFTNPIGDFSSLKHAYFSGQGKIPAQPYASKVVAYKQMCFE